MPSDAEDAYKALSRVVKTFGLGEAQVTDALLDCVKRSMAQLTSSGVSRDDLVSRVPGKNYFSFKTVTPKIRLSRGINKALWLDDVEQVLEVLGNLTEGDQPDSPEDLNAALYTAAIALPAALDVTKDNDQKSPGTFLEMLVGQLAAVRFGVRPTTTVIAPTLDLEIKLPTDFVFDLGPGKSRIHLPVKASTRERVIQVWAHQRVLDGMHGVNRFRGLLVVLAETNRQTSTNSIMEVCLPGQWTAYQMYIAQLHRVYYFDVPDKYRSLRNHYPFLEVRYFSEFFYEADEIAQPIIADDIVEALVEATDVDSTDDWIIGSVGATGPATTPGGLPEDEEV